MSTPIGLAHFQCAVNTEATWRVSVDVRALDRHPLDALRLLLVADVLHRFVEDLLGGRLLLAVLEHKNESSCAITMLAKALSIRPPAVRIHRFADAEALLGGPPTVVLEPAEPEWAGVHATAGEHTVRIAVVTHRAHGEAVAPGSALLRGEDPLAVRLALLRFPHSSQVVLSSARLHRAEETLQRWRFKVAYWKEMPEDQAPPQILDALQRPLLADLDTGTVLKLLHRVEIDPHLSSGSKFDIFTRLDQVLALDLRHLVGKLRR